MRSKKALWNVIINALAQVLNVVLALAVRQTFLVTLGADVLGLHSVFSSVLAFLALTELGLGVSVCMCLYKPLAENDAQKVAAYMKLLKKMYHLIGIGIFFIGILLTPFLHLFVEGEYTNRFVMIGFILFVASTSVSYLFSYKKILLAADQKSYIVSAVQVAYKLVLNAGQIAVLLLYENYFIFLTINIICTFLDNYVAAKICDRQYPYLKGKSKPLDSEDKQDIMVKVKGLLSFKISNYLIEGTDNIVISFALGTGLVAYYANYYLVINMLYAVLAGVAMSTVAGLGNMFYAEKGRLKETFSKLLLLQHFIYSFSATALLILMTDFISLMFGSEFALQFSVVLLMVIVYYIKGYSQALEAIRTSVGIYHKDQYINLGIAILSVALSVALVYQLGIAGVLIGTAIGYVLKELVVLPIIIFREVFSEQPRWYLEVFAKYTLITCIMAGLAYLILKNIYVYNNFITWVVKGFACLCISLIVNVIIFHNTKEYKDLMNMLSGMLRLKKS